MTKCLIRVRVLFDLDSRQRDSSEKSRDALWTRVDSLSWLTAMKFTKPAWVIHHGAQTSRPVLRWSTSPCVDVGEKEHKKRLSIFSIHVHPDGSRIATGGLGRRISPNPDPALISGSDLRCENPYMVHQAYSERGSAARCLPEESFHINHAHWSRSDY